MSLRPAVAVLVVLLLAFPAGALAQSAGDEQYADPFGEVESDDGGGGSNGADTPSSGSETPSDTVVQDQTLEEGAASEGTQAEAGSSLPRSGLPVGIVAGAGALLAAGGFTLRRRV